MVVSRDYSECVEVIDAYDTSNGIDNSSFPSRAPGRHWPKDDAMWEVDFGELIEQRIQEELAAIQRCVNLHSRQISRHVANLVRPGQHPSQQRARKEPPLNSLMLPGVAEPLPPDSTSSNVAPTPSGATSPVALLTTASCEYVEEASPKGRNAAWQPLGSDADCDMHVTSAAARGRGRRVKPAISEPATRGSRPQQVRMRDGSPVGRRHPVATMNSRGKAKSDLKDASHQQNDATTEDEGDEKRRHSVSSRDSDSSQSRKSKKKGRSPRGSVFSVSSQLFSGRGQKRAGRNAVFLDRAGYQADKILELMAIAYDVRQLYKEDGWCQAITRSTIFENITLACVASNAIWMWIDNDLNTGTVIVDSPPVFIVVENLFCFFFAWEWTMRAFSFKRFCSGLRDAWFVFDGLLALLMAFETWLLPLTVIFMGGGKGVNMNTSALRIIRLLRLSKLARMMRLVRFIPELMIMIKGLAAGFRSVMTTLVLLFVTVYVFALGFCNVTRDTSIGQDYFPTVFEAIMNLLVRGILPDHETFVYDLREYDPVLGFAGLVFVFIATLTILNLLVGVLCEAVSVVASVEKEQMAAELVKTSLAHILDDVDNSAVGDSDRQISGVEFDALVCRRDFAQAIMDVGVDIHGLCGLSQEVFAEGRSISFQDFYKLLLQMRGSNYATVKHIIDIRMDISDLKRILLMRTGSSNG
eukprot:TRINITY_DN55926_c0_g1_i1.p1 TRINITY_DN55926_c0_g1~~TRINITY_DN55926_c0_g1_i1.p1  ORF type:complete len:696 (-),score=97.35 TRINITY_DN55926_c0_g1_i1:110-2197(-)